MRRIEQGEAAEAVCRNMNISEATRYRWKQQYAAMELNEVKELKALRDENARLKRLVVDHAKMNMTRLRDRSPRGERPVCHAPHGHWRTTTMISSVRLGGTTACMTIEGATNTEVFHAYIRAVLVPSLRRGDIVVMDNLGTHKNERTIALIEAVGAEVRFLPAYFPDLNPIDMMWSKVKALLRKTAARNHPDLLVAIASALHAVTPQDTLGWFAACGYNFI